jgi:hypothetical protein
MRLSEGRLSIQREMLCRAPAVQLSKGNQVLAQGRSAADGRFVLSLHATGEVTVRADVAGFRSMNQTIIVRQNDNPLIVRVNELAPTTKGILVTDDVSHEDIGSPDPAMKVFGTEDLLDANPGRPGAPISIPGYPIETASSGIKAPQYFAPGVAGDHGEPIAQYIQVGSYLVANNLSANAHGNGYAECFSLGSPTDAHMTYRIDYERWIKKGPASHGTVSHPLSISSVRWLAVSITSGLPVNREQSRSLHKPTSRYQSGQLPRSPFWGTTSFAAQIGTTAGARSAGRSCRTCVVRPQAWLAPGAPPKAAGLSLHAL